MIRRKLVPGRKAGKAANRALLRRREVSVDSGANRSPRGPNADAPPLVVGQNDDTAVAAGCIGAGMLLGGLYASRHLGELGGGELTVTPQRQGVDGRTRYDVGMRFSF
jgi:hypothetical protein